MTSDSLPAASGSVPAAGEAPAKCPNCGAVSSGRFCSECGTALGAARCAACRTELTPGAKFCHRCGLPAGEVAPVVARGQNQLPWAVAIIASLAVIGLLAGQHFGKSRSDGAEASQTAAPASGGSGRAPDISNLTPEEQRSRLYDRVMRYAERGMQDSLALFAPMAIMAYQQFGPLDADGHYDLGRIGEVTGDAELATAQADTILKGNPQHLLGLILAAHAARMRKDAAAERRYFQQFVSAEKAEKAKQLPEYALHGNDISQAESDAKKAGVTGS